MTHQLTYNTKHGMSGLTLRTGEQVAETMNRILPKDEWRRVDMSTGQFPYMKSPNYLMVKDAKLVLSPQYLVSILAHPYFYRR